MKRLIIGILCLLPCLAAMAQGHVSTRKYILADFPDKVTKMVLPQDDFLESALKQEVVNNWTASAFEFCSQEEYEGIKDSDEYYFLLVRAFQFKGEEEPGVLFLSLLKGEKHEVISLPIAPADDSSGRELTYIGAIVKAVQDYTLAAMESEKTAYIPELWFNAKYTAVGKMMNIWMAREDLSLSVTEADIDKYIDTDWHICGAEEADAVFMDAPMNTIVSYTIAPVDPSTASFSYQLLFRADTLELCYITRHRIKPKAMAGFLTSDLKWLAKRR